MEVLKGKESSAADLGGQSLIQTIVSLTELPATWVHQEMDDMIRASGHRSESLTLEQLRAAMVSYLESIQADMDMDEDRLENDATHIKAPALFE